MTAYLLALAMMAQPNCYRGKTQVKQVASAIMTASSEKGLDPVLMAAIVLEESGGRNIIVHGRGRFKAGSEVGPFQIHCQAANPGCINKYRKLKEGARKAASILDEGRRICRRRIKRRFCYRGWWSWYNPGSSHWSNKVNKRIDALKDWLAINSKGAI